MNDVEIEEIENFKDAPDLRSQETPESTMMSNEIITSVNQTIEALPD